MKQIKENVTQIAIGLLGILVVIGVGYMVIYQVTTEVNIAKEFCKDKEGEYNLTNYFEYKFDMCEIVNCSLETPCLINVVMVI